MLAARARTWTRAEGWSKADSRRATPGTAVHVVIPERCP